MGGADAKASAPEKMAWKVVFEFAGNKIIHCVPKESVSGKDAYEMAAKYSVKTEKVEKSGDGEVTTLTQSEMSTILTSIETTVKSLMDQKNEVMKVQTTVDKLIHKINSLSSSSSKDDEKVGERSTKARSSVTALGNGAIKLITSVGSEVTRSCQAYLTYVERSIGAYSEDNDKDKK
jgi:transcription antitermination factor NusA-like protein